MLRIGTPSPQDAVGPLRVGLWRPIHLGLLAAVWAFGFTWCAAGLVLLVLLSIFPPHGEWFALLLSGLAGVPALCVGYLTGFGAYMDDLHRQRRTRGWCTRCGYDLRASSGRCPECGQRYIQRLWRRRDHANVRAAPPRFFARHLPNRSSTAFQASARPSDRTHLSI